MRSRVYCPLLSRFRCPYLLSIADADMETLASTASLPLQPHCLYSLTVSSSSPVLASVSSVVVQDVDECHDSVTALKRHLPNEEAER